MFLQAWAISLPISAAPLFGLLIAYHFEEFIAKLQSGGVSLLF
jgi:hypothetical protein